MIMRSGIVMSCLAVLAQAHEKQMEAAHATTLEDYADRLADQLVSRMLDRPLHNAHLENTMVEKSASHLAQAGSHPVSLRPQMRGQLMPSARSSRMAYGQFSSMSRSTISAGSSIPTVHTLQRQGHHAVQASPAATLDQKQKPVIAELKLSEQTKLALEKSFSSMPVQYYEDIEAFEQASSKSFREALSTTELDELETIFAPDGPATIHVTNVPVSTPGKTLIPTPNEQMEAMQPIHKSDTTSEACLVGAAATVGATTFTYNGFYGNDYVRNFPRKQGSDLGWHRDGVTAPPFRPPTQFFREEALVPELVLIFCLRGNAQARTMVVDFADLVSASDKNDIALLRSQPLVFYDTTYNNTMEPMYVVQGTDSAPVVELRPVERFEVRGEPQVISAYRRVYDLAERMHSSVTLNAGEMLIVNNKRCSHARSPYQKKEESSSDRWLQNVYASRRKELWGKDGQSYVSWPDRRVP